MFMNFKNRPSRETAIKMFVAGKYGGDNPLKLGGIEFALEYAFDEFNKVFEKIQTNQRWREETNINKWNVFHRAQDETWANLLFSIFIDEAYAPFISNLERSEFIRFTEREEELIHDTTRSIVFDLKFIGLRDPDFVKNQSNINFSEIESKGSKIYHYGIWISSPDLYEEEDREFHQVKSHKRCLISGKIVPVRAHERRNRLLSAQVPWDNFYDHIVYTVYDIEGNLRYIGEGRPDRYLHVNSGISHSYKINEHYFLRGKMDVKIVSEGLSKPKALAIEKFLIGRYKKDDLWNIKDNPDANKP